MSVVAKHPGAEPTFADVNRDVLLTLRPPGNLYFTWMCVIGLILSGGAAASFISVMEMAGTAREMIHLSIQALSTKDKDAAKKLMAEGRI